MRASVLAVLVNLVFNYLLIFGKLGLPALGVKGAAIATVLSRVVELLVVVVTAHKHQDRFPFLKGLYRSARIAKDLAVNITIKGMPLFVNEFFWSAGTITITQILSTRGLTVVGGLNIASTFTNLFGVVFFSCGIAVAIVTGQTLGSGDVELAKAQVWKLMFLAVALASSVGIILAISAGWITQIHRTEVEVRQLAAMFMGSRFHALHGHLPLQLFYHPLWGKDVPHNAFDSVYVFVICIPYTYTLVTFTDLGIESLYPLSQLTQPLKAVLGLAL